MTGVQTCALPISLSLDIGGTDFQQQVWSRLLEIPRGETRTYKDLALDLGRPRVARAVGGACGANPVPLLIPCHRVRASNGSLGGFSAAGGSEVKMRLLAWEASQTDRVAPRDVFQTAGPGGTAGPAGPGGPGGSAGNDETRPPSSLPQPRSASHPRPEPVSDSNH